MTERSSEVIDIPRHRLDEAVEVLVQAFEDDPAIHYLLEPSLVSYLKSRDALLRFSCLVRLELEWPLIGVEADGRLAGVLGVTMPGDDRWPDSLKQIYENLGTTTGPTVVQRLEAYSELADSRRPSETHFHVGVVGVRPGAQGRGIGRLLIDAVQAMSETHESSVGVALDTENPASRAFYERCGYHVADEDQIEDVTVWSMFRPNSVKA